MNEFSNIINQQKYERLNSLFYNFKNNFKSYKYNKVFYKLYKHFKIHLLPCLRLPYIIYKKSFNTLPESDKEYIKNNFYLQYVDFDPYYGPSEDYYYINPLCVCKNKSNYNCHPGFGCLECKNKGYRILKQ